MDIPKTVLEQHQKLIELMNKEQTKIQVGLRLTENINNTLDEQAKRIGISKNSFLAVLIDLGLQAYEAIPKIGQSK